MKLQLFEYCCESGHLFRAPELPGGSYGEFLLRDQHGMSTAYLNAFDDATYQEVDSLLESHPALAGVSATKRADILRSIYGSVACDRTVDGGVLRIGQHPRCPVCSTVIMRSWDAVRPAEYVDIDVPKVTHSRWSSLDRGQKLDSVAEALLRKGSAPTMPASKDAYPRVPAGEPCPGEGWWFSPAKLGSRRYFKRGEVMPKLDTGYGDTFWQWDKDQGIPKL